MKFKIKILILVNFLFAVLIINLSYTLPSNAELFCNDRSACAITDEIEDGKVALSIKNNLTCEITVTIEFTKLENVSSNVRLPYTLTVPGEKTVKVLTLERDDLYQKWEYYFKFYAVEGITEAYHDDDYVYSLPYASGKSYIVTQGFNGTFSHKGEQKYSIDWGMPEGTEIFAARDGVVVAIKEDSNTGGSDKKFASYANYIIIKHEDGTFGTYLHLKKKGVKVSVGQKVRSGERIGFSGNTGWSGAPHLHFWVFKAISGKQRESFPIRFKTSEDDSTILLEGNYYTAP